MDEIQVFLSRCSELKEVQFQEDVVRPFLISLGAKNLQKTHGPNERGKDFLYITSSVYGEPELHACVVKNGKFTGRANDSNSVQTALNQIHTARITTAINPVTNAEERPRGVCFVSSCDFPDTSSGSLGREFEDCRQYCTFITGEQFAEKFKRNCSKRFYEIVRPGSFISARLRETIKGDSEALVRKLAIGGQLRIFVDMRLLAESEQLKKYIAEHRRPKAVVAEHIPKSIVRFGDVYEECMREYCEVPRVFDYDSEKIAGKATENTTEKGKIAVKSVNLDSLYDWVEGLHSGAVKVKGASAADMVFGAHSFLGYLLEKVGDLKHTTKAKDSPFGIIGTGVDAVDLLSKSNDSLFIIGDPGGGKTFTAQELAIRISDLGCRVVYFPCSRIKSAEIDLMSAIVDYVQTVTGESASAAKAFVDDAEAIIVDGLDEAVSLDDGLIVQLLDLARSQTPVTVPNEKTSELEILPDEMRSKFSIRRSAGIRQLVRQEFMHWNEATIVQHIAEGKEPWPKMRSGGLCRFPRLIVTCRESAGIELGPAFRTLTLLPFSDSELNRFIDEHCRAAGKEASELHAFLHEHAYIYDVCLSSVLIFSHRALSCVNLAWRHCDGTWETETAATGYVLGCC
jgi:hypothetical protein